MFKGFSNVLSLFGATSSLICCALPALLVSLGAGATLAGFVSRYPQLVWLSERSLWIFFIAGGLILLGGYAQWRARFEPCPIDPKKAQACRNLRRMSLGVYSVSVLIFVGSVLFTTLGQWLI